MTADVPGAHGPCTVTSRHSHRSPEAIILPTGGSMGAANSTVAEALRNSPAVLKGRVYKINDDYLARPGPRAVDGLEEMAARFIRKLSNNDRGLRSRDGARRLDRGR